MRRDGTDTLPLTLTLIPEANNGRDLISCWSGDAPEAHRSNNGRRRDGSDTLPLSLTLIPAANNGRRIRMALLKACLPLEKKIFACTTEFEKKLLLYIVARVVPRFSLSVSAYNPHKCLLLF
jgi:hypothetical protein